MPKVTFVDSSGTRKTIEAANNLTLMEVATRNDVPGIIAACGGACSCATCMVHVQDDWVGQIEPADESEKMMIEFALEPRPNSRLACQIVLSDKLDGLVVEVPVNQV